jgi:hypothetical protein
MDEVGLLNVDPHTQALVDYLSGEFDDDNIFGARDQKAKLHLKTHQQQQRRRHHSDEVNADEDPFLNATERKNDIAPPRLGGLRSDETQYIRSFAAEEARVWGAPHFSPWHNFDMRQSYSPQTRMDPFPYRSLAGDWHFYGVHPSHKCGDVSEEHVTHVLAVSSEAPRTLTRQLREQCVNLVHRMAWTTGTIFGGQWTLRFLLRSATPDVAWLCFLEAGIGVVALSLCVALAGNTAEMHPCVLPVVFALPCTVFALAWMWLGFDPNAPVIVNSLHMAWFVGLVGLAGAVAQVIGSTFVLVPPEENATALLPFGRGAVQARASRISVYLRNLAKRRFRRKQLRERRKRRVSAYSLGEEVQQETLATEERAAKDRHERGYTCGWPGPPSESYARTGFGGVTAHSAHSARGLDDTGIGLEECLSAELFDPNHTRANHLLASLGLSPLSSTGPSAASDGGARGTMGFGISRGYSFTSGGGSVEMTKSLDRQSGSGRQMLELDLAVLVEEEEFYISSSSDPEDPEDSESLVNSVDSMASSGPSVPLHRESKFYLGKEASTIRLFQSIPSHERMDSLHDIHLADAAEFTSDCITDDTSADDNLEVAHTLADGAALTSLGKRGGGERLANLFSWRAFGVKSSPDATTTTKHQKQVVSETKKMKKAKKQKIKRCASLSPVPPLTLWSSVRRRKPAYSPSAVDMYRRSTNPGARDVFDLSEAEVDGQEHYNTREYLHVCSDWVARLLVSLVCSLQAVLWVFVNILVVSQMWLPTATEVHPLAQPESAADGGVDQQLAREVSPKNTVFLWPVWLAVVHPLLGWAAAVAALQFVAPLFAWSKGRIFPKRLDCDQFLWQVSCPFAIASQLFVLRPGTPTAFLRHLLVELVVFYGLELVTSHRRIAIHHVRRSTVIMVQRYQLVAKATALACVSSFPVIVSSARQVGIFGQPVGDTIGGTSVYVNPWLWEITSAYETSARVWLAVAALLLQIASHVTLHHDDAICRIVAAQSKVRLSWADLSVWIAMCSLTASVVLWPAIRPSGG